MSTGLAPILGLSTGKSKLLSFRTIVKPEATNVASMHATLRRPTGQMDAPESCHKDAPTTGTVSEMRQR